MSFNTVCETVSSIWALVYGGFDAEEFGIVGMICDEEGVAVARK